MLDGDVTIANLDVAQHTLEVWGAGLNEVTDLSVSGSATSLTITFFGLNEGAIVASFGGVGLQISYVAGDGNDIVLVAVPNITVPESFTIVTGSLDSGGLPELLQSDNQYLVMDPTFDTFRYLVVFTIDATAPTILPSSLEFACESKAFNIIGTVEQKIELYNYSTAQYETVDLRITSLADSVANITPGGDPARFVESGTRAMRARVSYHNGFSFWVFVVSALFPPYETSVDQIYWTVTP